MGNIDERQVQLLLAVVGFAAFVVLFVARLRLSRRYHAFDMGRLLLIDALLVIAGMELVADAMETIAPAGGLDVAAKAVAFACRGALVAGGIALVATIDWHRQFNGDHYTDRRR